MLKKLWVKTGSGHIGQPLFDSVRVHEVRRASVWDAVLDQIRVEKYSKRMNDFV